MKRIYKSSSPPKRLAAHLESNPQGTWQAMQQGDPPEGRQTALDCRHQAALDQGKLCAYCESKIDSADPLRCSVEHFHPKSDGLSGHNWGLDWQNMLVVCDGGQRASKEEPRIWPLPGNLSCDAYKNHVIQTGKLPVNCEGKLLNPLDLPSFPNLFVFDRSSGHLSADVTAYNDLNLTDNCFSTTQALVENTICMLNLNCERLAGRRLQLVVNIDKNKEILRKNGGSSKNVLDQLVKRYFSHKWPQFFTTIRCCIGQPVEDYLRTINFQG
jgi:uncharacterized protein (TIGR02646 family)